MSGTGGEPRPDWSKVEGLDSYESRAPPTTSAARKTPPGLLRDEPLRILKMEGMVLRVSLLTEGDMCKGSVMIVQLKREVRDLRVGGEVLRAYGVDQFACECLCGNLSW